MNDKEQEALPQALKQALGQSIKITAERLELGTETDLFSRGELIYTPGNSYAYFKVQVSPESKILIALQSIGRQAFTDCTVELITTHDATHQIAAGLSFDWKKYQSRKLASPGFSLVATTPSAEVRVSQGISEKDNYSPPLFITAQIPFLSGLIKYIHKEQGWDQESKRAVEITIGGNTNLDGLATLDATKVHQIMTAINNGVLRIDEPENFWNIVSEIIN